MKSLTPFNLSAWINEHRDAFKPPVCNRQVFDEDDFIVMIVGGPNSRNDYHVDEGPELFFQIEGDMLLRVIDDFMWFCENCDNKLYEEFVHVEDIVAQLPPIFDRFHSSEDNRRCDHCDTVMPLPAAAS